MQVVCYRNDSQELRRRLVGEFAQASPSWWSLELSTDGAHRLVDRLRAYATFGGGQFRAGLGGLTEHIATTFLQTFGAVLVAVFHTGFECHADGSCAGGVTRGMAQRAAIKLQTCVVAKDGLQCRHVPDVDTTEGNREHSQHGTLVQAKEDATAAVFFDETVTHDVDPAQGGVTIALQLADYGA